MPMQLTIPICEALRRQIKPIADDCASLRVDALAPDYNAEAMANVILAYRHLEDAAMRLGKAIQALDGGTSVYDKTQTPDA